MGEWVRARVGSEETGGGQCDLRGDAGKADSSLSLLVLGAAQKKSARYSRHWYSYWSV